MINRKIINNIEMIGKSNMDDKLYQQYECKCGRNGVIYVDGKLYHCLSQAIFKDKPISLYNKKEIKWKNGQEVMDWWLYGNKETDENQISFDDL